MAKEKILALNPGSTSTKVAVYEGENLIWSQSADHPLEELKQYPKVYDQLHMRASLVRSMLDAHGDKIESFQAVASRGGNMPPVRSGAYLITDYMVDCLKNRPIDEHAANVGAGIALELAKEAGISAYVYDALTVDEMLPVNTVTGLKGIRRPARGHNLNTRAAALKLCEDKGIDYQKSNIIAAHLGGGITINLQSEGKIIDVIMDEEGPFSPERAGGLPVYAVVQMAFDNECDQRELMRRLQRTGGMISHFGTADMRKIEKMIEDGNPEAELVYQAMALAVAKNIAKIAPVVKGRVDHVVLTGGLAYSARFTGAITAAVSFIAPVTVIPGENEMPALAQGILRVLRGAETARTLEEESHLDRRAEHDQRQ